MLNSVNSTSKSSSIRSLKCFCRASKSQIACSGIRLSAITIERFSGVLRPAIVTVGTSVMPRRLAASSRPWPARMVPVSSIRIGLVQTRRMLFMSPAIWASGCRLGFPGNDFSVAGGRHTTLSVRPRGRVRSATFLAVRLAALLGLTMFEIPLWAASMGCRGPIS